MHARGGALKRSHADFIRLVNDCPVPDSDSILDSPELECNGEACCKLITHEQCGEEPEAGELEVEDPDTKELVSKINHFSLG